MFLYLVGAGAMSLGTALLTSTTLPSIVCSVLTTISAAKMYVSNVFVFVCMEIDIVLHNVT